MTFLLMLPNFNPLRRLEVFFFSLLFEISRPSLLGLVSEVNKAAWLKLQEVTSLAQHEKFHMANFHVDSTS